MAPESLDATTLHDLVDGYKVSRALLAAFGLHFEGVVHTRTATSVLEASR